ncbi:MAG: tetratricopeptide repeat protein [Gammaproteobacteria bacterium]|nr:tetratricopeptide repeat protein [Gammaproteobacteria bacterium]
MKTRLRAICCAVLLSVPAVAAETAVDYYESALTYSHQQQWREAELELRNSLKINPNYLPARLLLGRVLLQTEQWPSAEKELTLALDGGAAADPLVFDVIRTLLAQQKADEASFMLTRFVELQQLPSYRLMQANLAKLRFQYPEAATIYSSLVKTTTAETKLTAELSAEARYEYADLLFKQQQYALVDAELAQISKDSTQARKVALLQAKLFQHPQKLPQAEAIYSELLQRDANDAAAIIGKAQLLIARNALTDALALVVKFRELQPNNPYGQLLHASILGLQGDESGENRLLKQIQQQLASFDSAVREAEDVLMLSAMLDFSDEKYEQVITKLNRYQQLYPNNSQVSQLLAQSYLQSNDPQLASKHIREAIVQNPTDANLYLISAAIARAEKDTKLELAVLQEAVGRFANNDAIRRGYVQALLRNQQQAKARDFLGLNDKNSETMLADQLLLGYLQLETGLFKDALATAQTLLDLTNSKVEVFQFAGDVSAKTGDQKLAAQLYQQALVLDADYKPALLSLASLKLQQQDWQGASSIYQQILSKTPDDQLVLQLLADAAIKLRQLPAAIGYLEQLNADDSSSAPARMALLELYLQTGDTSKAGALAEQLTEQVSIAPTLYLAKARLALTGQNLEQVRHNTAILYGLWYDNAVRLVDLADLQLRAQDQQGLAATLQRLSELKAPAAQQQFLLVRQQLMLGEFSNGLKNLKKLTSHIGSTVETQELEAHLLIGLGQLSDAARLLEPLLAKSESPTHLILLLHCRQADTAAVTNILQTWLAKHPNDLNATLLLAEQLTNAGQKQHAIALYQQSPLLNSQAILQNNLANLLLSVDAAAALKWAEQAHNSMPEQPDILDTYGIALAKAGKLNEALTTLRDAEIRLPQSALVQMHLAETLWLLKRPSEAKMALSKAAALPLSAAEKKELQDLQQLIR